MKKNIAILFSILLHGQIQAQSIPFAQPINTGYDEYNPCISGNGRTLIFEQLYQNDPKAYVQISVQKNGVWSQPAQLPGANTEILTIENGGFFLNQNGDVILFHSARYGGVGGNDIWMIEKNITGNWGAPVNLAKPINTTGGEINPSLSPDGKFLFFTRVNVDGSKTPDGSPCGKIYMAERVGKDRWKMPVLMPAPINSACECSGKMLSDNKTFLISSMRPGGAGGLDIYMTKQKTDGTWESPVPYAFINTPKDDKSVSVPAGGGLVFHAIKGATGGLDIVRTPIPENLQPDKMFLWQGVMKNAETNLPITPKITVTNCKTNKSTTYVGANDGSYVALVPQDEKYDVAFQCADGGYAHVAYFSEMPAEKKYTEITKDVKLLPLKPGTTFMMSNLSFKDNGTTFSDLSTAELFRLIIMLKAYPTLKVELGVHTSAVVTDTVPSPDLTNTWIDSSQTITDTLGNAIKMYKKMYSSDNTDAQGKALLDYCISKGIPAERIKVVGYSDKKPLNPAPADPRMNRRAEIKISSL